VTAASDGPNPQAGALRAQRAVLATVVVLAACVVVAALRSAPWPGNLVMATALVAPLALPLPGILRRQRRTFAWATLCVTPYFIYGTTEVIANPRLRLASGAILIASLALFVSLVAYLRLTRPEGTHAQPS
jgi:uncharacterized membrane protein